MLREITPVVLTFDEAPNIGRCLEKLAWAKDVVVVDSFSRDATPELVRSFSNARFFQRSFDTHAAQWAYALTNTAITTSWVLALDADYILTPDFIDEIKRLSPNAPYDGYRVPFRYCLNGRPLRTSVYPALCALFRREKAIVVQDGHTQKISVQGPEGLLRGPILHDDRKQFDRWFQTQKNYMKLETAKLKSARWATLAWPDRARRLRVIAPPMAFFYCLFGKGLILDGSAGILYSSQRALAEAILSFYLLRGDLRRIMEKPR